MFVRKSFGRPACTDVEPPIGWCKLFYRRRSLSLKGHAEIIAKAVLPLGAAVRLDYLVENIVVFLGDKGFAIARKWLSDYDPEAVAEDVLIAAGKSESKCKRFVSRQKIRSRYDQKLDNHLRCQLGSALMADVPCWDTEGRISPRWG